MTEDKAAPIPVDVTKPDPVNTRTIPHDLYKKRFSNGYVVGSCATKRVAERAVLELMRAGFQRDTLVLVSDEIDTLRPTALGDTFQVANPTSLAKASGIAAGAMTGAAVGASLTSAATFLLSSTGADLAQPALIGGLVGAVLGAVAGRIVSVRMRRSPASVYDERFIKSEIMVGVGIESDDPERNRVLATAALTRAKLVPNFLEGE